MVFLAGLALAACAQQQPQIATLSTTQLVPAQNAFAVPGPGGPAVMSVVEQRYANAVEQQIALSTSSHVSGQNMLRVQLFGPLDRGTTGQTRLREGYLPPGNVTAEMRRLIPGVRMVQSPYYVQNRYGPFGYAVGRASSGDTCLYGWQGLTSTGNAQTLIGNKGSIQIRLRYCDGALSEQRLLQAMYDYTISAYFRSGNWNPYGEPNAPDASLGKAGAPLYPVGKSETATVTGPPARREPTGPRSSTRQATRIVAMPKAEPVGPVVPAPPVSGATSATPGRLERTAPAERGGPPAVIVPPPPCDPAGGTCG
jgi:hypothetical protein